MIFVYTQIIYYYEINQFFVNNQLIILEIKDA